MGRLPIVDAKTMEKVLIALGFQSRDLSRPLIREILREIEVQPEAFQTALSAL